MYNTVFSTCNPNEDYAVQAAVLFNMQPKLTTHEDRIPPLPLQSATAPAAAVASRSRSSLTTATTSAPVGHVPGPISASASVPALVPPPISTMGLVPVPAISAHLPPSVVPDLSDLEEGELRDNEMHCPGSTQARPAISIFHNLNTGDDNMDWSPSDANVATSSVHAPHPAVICLNDPMGHVHPCPPPLIPHYPFADSLALSHSQSATSRSLATIPSTDGLDLDTAMERLIASMKLKWKMLTPENSSKETNIKPWFSTSSTSSATSASFHKCQWPAGSIARSSCRFNKHGVHNHPDNTRAEEGRTT